MPNTAEGNNQDMNIITSQVEQKIHPTQSVKSSTIDRNYCSTMCLFLYVSNTSLFISRGASI